MNILIFVSGHAFDLNHPTRVLPDRSAVQVLM